MWNQFSSAAKQSILHAQRVAERHSQKEVSLDHMLLGILQDPECTASRIAGRLGVQRAELMAHVEKRQTKGACNDAERELSATSKTAIDRAYKIRRLHHGSIMETEHLLAGALQVAEEQGEMLYANAALSVARVQPEIGRKDVGAPEDIVWPPPPAFDRTPAAPAQSEAASPAARIGFGLAMLSVGVSGQYVSSTPPSVPWRVTHPLLVTCNIAALGFGWAARN